MAYMETCGAVMKGETVMQIGMGGGMKARRGQECVCVWGGLRGCCLRVWVIWGSGGAALSSCCRAWVAGRCPRRPLGLGVPEGSGGILSLFAALGSRPRPLPVATP
jgi:hypothetical protein